MDGSSCIYCTPRFRNGLCSIIGSFNGFCVAVCVPRKADPMLFSFGPISGCAVSIRYCPMCGRSLAEVL